MVTEAWIKSRVQLRGLECEVARKQDLGIGRVAEVNFFFKCPMVGMFVMAKLKLECS
jgi:hypothetical protein